MLEIVATSDIVTRGMSSVGAAVQRSSVVRLSLTALTSNNIRYFRGAVPFPPCDIRRQDAKSCFINVKLNRAVLTFFDRAYSIDLFHLPTLMQNSFIH
jgi:hypothetical protein